MNSHVSKKNKDKFFQRGQVAVEYMLLLMIAVITGAIIMRALVSRDSQEPGFLTKRWYDIIYFIGQDTTNK